ncbi:secreted Ly-6/uPAR domain-containing protein 2 [Talpa occidentalis]|uniref:secreted Ly-6/uPAR domain-containing protein 2 n=1 Tax=Talpa occidentalis TaxID=50954 RepID=UPI0023F7BB44|nr:secreted Ly-6/uPAR domain-containing protein 2 [Talpa occidentalis]
MRLLLGLLLALALSLDQGECTAPAPGWDARPFACPCQGRHPPRMAVSVPGSCPRPACPGVTSLGALPWALCSLVWPPHSRPWADACLRGPRTPPHGAARPQWPPHRPQHRSPEQNQRVPPPSPGHLPPRWPGPGGVPARQTPPPGPLRSNHSLHGGVPSHLGLPPLYPPIAAQGRGPGQCVTGHTVSCGVGHRHPRPLCPSRAPPSCAHWPPAAEDPSLLEAPPSQSPSCQDTELPRLVTALPGGSSGSESCRGHLPRQCLLTPGQPGLPSPRLYSREGRALWCHQCNGFGGCLQQSRCARGADHCVTIATREWGAGLGRLQPEGGCGCPGRGSSEQSEPTGSLFRTGVATSLQHLPLVTKMCFSGCPDASSLGLGPHVSISCCQASLCNQG